MLQALLALCLLAACGSGTEGDAVALDVPEGFQPVVELERNGNILQAGPFVGYYFRPVQAGDPSRLEFVCFNEEGFYASDMPVNARLFEGDAVLATLPDAGTVPERGGRIRPVFFRDAPGAWLATRPEPAEEFRHFHSCHGPDGASRTGYWLRHRAVAAFTYDMGGRVGPDSRLHHRVEPGVDTDFARIVEFDFGPSRAQGGNGTAGAASAGTRQYAAHDPGGPWRIAHHL
jgi:hypothetical protein